MTQARDDGPVGDSGYLVKQGDCIESIAEKHGIFWRTIWDASENAALKSVRKNPNAIFPGDKVFLPAKDLSPLDCATDTKHRFLRKGVPSELRVAIRYAGKPVKDTAYSMNVDGVFIDGETDADGMVIQKISPGAKKCMLTVGADSDFIAYEIYLGKQDPLSELSGVQNRLINLGYDTSECRSQLCPETAGAIRAFQKEVKLPMTGEIDQDTKDALKSVYGS